MTAIERLQDWYASCCDGDWEHSFGVQLETLDNPGWALTVDLQGTELQERMFDAVTREGSQAGVDWLHCAVNERQFVGACGARNLDEMLNTFLTWANALKEPR